jgi:hypothetical protein
MPVILVGNGIFSRLQGKLDLELDSVIGMTLPSSK